MTEKKPAKTPEERQAINEAVTQEERLKVVKERMSPLNTARKSITLAVGFHKGTEVHKLVEKMSYYFGSPISAELNEDNRVIFQIAKETGLIRWRADETTPEEANDAVKAVALAVLASEDPSFVAQVVRVVATSKYLSGETKARTRRFFANLEQYRNATTHIRKREKMNGARKELKGPTREEALALVYEEFGTEAEERSPAASV